MSRLGFAYKEREILWYAVDVLFNGRLVYVGLVEEHNFAYNAPKRYFTFLRGGEVWTKINNEPLPQKDADSIRRERLSDLFDRYGDYPDFNQLEFNNEFDNKYAQYSKGWEGPIEIKKEEIEKKIDKGHQNGNYIYGHYDLKRNFVVDYVGRCTDEELQIRIQHRLDPNDNNYKKFNDRKTTHVQYRYAKNDTEAVEIECLLYHKYGGKVKLVNNEHPGKKNDIRCPLSLCKYYKS